MSALTRVISLTKRSAIYVAIFFVAFLLLSFAVYIISVSISNYLKSTKAVQAQNGFGVIPKATFSKISISQSSNPQFILDNTVNLNNYPQLVNVYTLNKPKLTLNSLNTVQTLISNMGISGANQSSINPYTYSWTTPHHQVIFNLNDLSFNVSLLDNLSSYLNYQSNNNNGTVFNFTQASDASNAVYSFLSGLSYQNASGDTVNLMNMNSNYFSSVPVTINNNNIDLSNATGTLPNAYYVFYRKHVGGYKVYGTNPYKTSINFLIDDTTVSGLEGVLSAQFTNYTIGQSSTYFILSPYQAFLRLKDGGGALVSAYQNLNGNPYSVNYNADYSISKVYVNNITLGYYETNVYTRYLVPIYVLSGEMYLTNGQTLNFSYYVNALQY